MPSDLDRLKHEYEQAKAQLSATNEDAIETERLLREVESFQNHAIGQIKDGRCPDAPTLWFALFVPQIVREELKTMNTAWLKQSEIAATLLREINLRLSQ